MDEVLKKALVLEDPDSLFHLQHTAIPTKPVFLPIGEVPSDHEIRAN